MEQTLARLRGQGTRLYFIVFEIIALKKINCAYGRRTGDALIDAVCRWMNGFRDQSLFHIEQNQFCLLFAGLPRSEMLRRAATIENRFELPWRLQVEERTIEVVSKINAAIIPDEPFYWTQSVPELFERALDAAQHKQQLVVYDRPLDQEARDWLRMQIELKSSIISGMRGFSVNFQPIADGLSGVWRGVEALCRWNSSEVGKVPPSVFIPEVEDIGLIHQLGHWVLEISIKACKSMGLDAIEGFFLSVNVSALQITHKDYARRVLSLCERHQYPCNKLLLEITESTKFIFNDTTNAAVAALRAKGVMFALDDFGTGYSTFNNLKKLPVDYLKTERDFILDIESDSYLQYFYYIMSETAHANGMKMIAEGIETPDQLNNVLKNGADLMQGYLFGRPMEFWELNNQLEKFHRPLPEFQKTTPSFSDFKNWISSKEAYSVTPALFRLLNHCMRIMMDESDMDIAYHQVLGVVGSHFKVNRAYAFLREGGSLFSNTYEWCAPGVASQKHLFQKIDPRLDGFYDVLCESEVVMASSGDQLPTNMHSRLEAGGQGGTVHAFVVLPMKRKNEIIGFVGMDDSTDRTWLLEEIIMLHNLALFSLIILNRDGGLNDTDPYHKNLEGAE